MSIQIRQAKPEDSDILSGLEAVLQSRPETDYVSRLLASQIAGERAVLLALDGLEATGYVVLNWKPAYNLFARFGMPEIQDLNVLPDSRCQGIGHALVTACESLAREKDCAQMGLAVGLTSSYGSAQRLYTRMGYIPDGYGITYDRQPVTPGELRAIDDLLCLMMVKDLSG